MRDTDEWTASGVQPWMKGNGLAIGAQQCGRWGWHGLRVWDDVSCDEKRPATCQVGTITATRAPDSSWSPPPPPPTRQPTPQPFQFKFLKQRLTFDEAERECKALGGHLASIHSEPEFKEVYALVKQEDSWLGLTTGLPLLLHGKQCHVHATS